MTPCSLRHLSDQALLSELSTIVARDRANTAALLAHLAEVDARRLYAPAGYPSMFAFCVEEIGFSEDSALLRIRVARTAREFPAIFGMVADGRLALSAISLLAPCLTAQTADELLSACARKTRSEIELLLAARFPRPDLPTRVEPLSLPAPPVAATHSFRNEFVATTAPPAPRPRIAPLAPERFALQVTIGQSAHDKLRHAQALLGPQVAPGDVAEVLERALDALIVQLEKRKCGATDRPRRPRRASRDPRHIPAHVKREVWQRDGGRCTFVSDSGRRCEARERLEFDHENEIARGGQATVSNLRLRCRAHNQYAAERTFGADFMSHKRREAAEARAAERDVVPWLRRLGFGAEEARRAAEHCERLPDATLEARVRAALSMLAPAARRTPGAPGAGGARGPGRDMATRPLPRPESRWGRVPAPAP